MRIHGLGVISDAVLELGPGLTVVTGETGAGKTMVVTGLGLLFGGRADSSRLRPGVEAASVEGRLRVADRSPAAELVSDAGGDLEEDGTLVLRRVVTANGRSRAAARGAGHGARPAGRRPAGGARSERPAPADPAGRAARHPGPVRRPRSGRVPG